MSDSASLWTVACQAPLFLGFSKTRMPSRGSCQPRDWTHNICNAGGFFTTEPPGKPESTILQLKKKKSSKESSNRSSQAYQWDIRQFILLLESQFSHVSSQHHEYPVPLFIFVYNRDPKKHLHIKNNFII